MIDKSTRRDKSFITEDHVSTLLQRYSVNTVLALLQEVAQVAGEKIDWHEMVKKTATGISGAREYQMLWRHLAYGETLTDQFDHGDVIPMDYDSDLEYEVEAFPNVGDSTEAAACVRVLISSGHDSRLPSNLTVEAPLIINIPNSRAVPAPSDSSLVNYAMHGTNITIPVTVQRQPGSEKRPSVCGEKRPNDGASAAANMPPRRRRKPWTTEEDMKLTAAVQKYGERNWVNIAKVDFDNDKSSKELSQRWSNLKKKQGNVKVGTTSSQPPETQLEAVRRAMSFALDMPRQITTGIKSQQQPQKPSATPPGQQSGKAGPTKPQIPTTRPFMNPSPTPDSMVKAAAVAAGARIASSADANSLMEAARSQNVVHITTAGCGSTPVMKSATTTTATTLGIMNQLPSNVHFIRNGLAKAPFSTYPAAKPNISRPAAVQPNNPAGPTTSSAVELHRTAGKVSTPRNEIKVPVQRHRDADCIEKHETKDEGKENTNRQCLSKGYS